ncbi:MAG: efflux RND transporter permease subunit [Candidatus Nanopelagicales bacterium]
MYRLAKWSLANRSVVALATLAIALFGIVSAGALKQELIPSLQIPVVAVVAVDPGSPPELIDRQISEPLSEAVQGISGVEKVNSTSATSTSTLTIELTYGTDLDAALSSIQQAIDRTNLPTDVEPMAFAGSFDDFPVVQLAVSGKADEFELADSLESELLPELQAVPGVREATVSGQRAQQVHIALDLAKLTAAGISPTELSSLLKANGVSIPAGTITEDDQTLSVQAGSAITTVGQLAALPLTSAATGKVIRLDSVAEVALGTAPRSSYSRVNGKAALAIAVTKTPQGNTVEVSHGVTDAVAAYSAAHPGTEVAVTYDQAPFIEDSIRGLGTEGGLGLLMAVLVILAFLASIRSTLVAAISIPLSLLVTFIGLRVGGYSLNILTLGAMTVAIGRVVDDSIVVIENIKRHLSYGESTNQAIVGAVREVAGAVTASTATTVAVFLPIGLVGGMVGELFRPFAMTVALAMVASLVVSLTVVPVLAGWLLANRRTAATPGELAAVRLLAEEKERRGRLQRSYLATLRQALAHPWATLALAGAILVATMALVPRLETNFFDNSGQNTLTVTQQFAPATSLAAQNRAAKTVEAALAEIAGVQTVQSTVGSGDAAASAFMGGGSAPRASFAITTSDDADSLEVTEAVRATLAQLPTDQGLGTLSVATADSSFGSSTVDVVVQARDGQALAKTAKQVTELVTDTPGTTDVTNNLAADIPTVKVSVDRKKAAAFGLTESTVAGVVAQSLNAATLGQVTIADQRLDVVLRTGTGPQSVAELEKLPLPVTPIGAATTAESAAAATTGAAGSAEPAQPTIARIVTVGDVAEVETVPAPQSITRIDGERAATVSATPAGTDLGALTTQLQSAIDALDVPSGVSVRMGGVAADQRDAFADLGLAVLIAIALVYLIMVATFGSLVQPLILLISVPFAATGALLGLLATGTALGVPALIGVLMLVGIVVTNAIVLIDLINQYRERGRPLSEAVTEGARKRLRPIIMTAAATIFALIPMAFGLTGGGVFISKPLAIVVIGGLLSSTALTLILVPVLYTLVERMAGRFRARPAEQPAPAEPDEEGDPVGVGAGNLPSDG